MNLYIYMVGDELEELEEIVEPVTTAITDWLAANENIRALLVNQQDDGGLKLGIDIEVNNKRHLKSPLKFLQGLAKTHKQDFVVGILQDSGDREDVCYFGFEEGRPDELEIANYLDL